MYHIRVSRIVVVVVVVAVLPVLFCSCHAVAVGATAVGAAGVFSSLWCYSTLETSSTIASATLCTNITDSDYPSHELFPAVQVPYVERSGFVRHITLVRTGHATYPCTSTTKRAVNTWPRRDDRSQIPRSRRSTCTQHLYQRTGISPSLGETHTGTHPSSKHLRRFVNRTAQL